MTATRATVTLSVHSLLRDMETQGAIVQAHRPCLLVIATLYVRQIGNIRGRSWG